MGKPFIDLNDEITECWATTKDSSHIVKHGLLIDIQGGLEFKDKESQNVFQSAV
jgi:hypothetical protein